MALDFDIVFLKYFKATYKRSSHEKLFHDIWYERYAIREQTNHIISYFLISVIT